MAHGTHTGSRAPRRVRLVVSALVVKVAKGCVSAVARPLSHYPRGPARPGFCLSDLKMVRRANSGALCWNNRLAVLRPPRFRPDAGCLGA
jgi:hypothetical protein